MDSLTPSPAPSRDAALAARYASARPVVGPWNETLEVLLSHRSVRGYRPDPVPAGTLETLIAAAQSAATSSNIQAWSAVVVSDPATRRELATIAGGQKHIEQCPLFIAWVADLARNERIGTGATTTLETLPWLETFLVAAVDTALAAQNAVVAAESLGLSTVYIGAMRNDPLRVAELLGLPPRAFVAFGLCVGYAAPGAEGEVKPRLPQEAVLHHERYDADAAPARLSTYDSDMAAFNRRQRLPAASWTARMLDRMGPLKSMNGRERLRAALARLGFDIR